jgi:polyisoprenoid-binding protein YceI
MSTQAPVRLATWTIDEAHSTADFSIRHMMISTITGRFAPPRGAVQFDGSDLTTASVEATIDAATISTNQEQRDGHLRSADFFDVEQYSTITFRSTRVEHLADDAYRVHGDLTLHGVTRPVALEVMYAGQITDPFGCRRAGFAAEVTLSRKDYGLTYNAVLEAGGVALGEKVKVAIHLQVVRQG